MLERSAREISIWIANMHVDGKQGKGAGYKLD